MGADYSESVGGNKKQVVKPSFLRNFQSGVAILNRFKNSHRPPKKTISEMDQMNT